MVKPDPHRASAQTCPVGNLYIDAAKLIDMLGLEGGRETRKCAHRIVVRELDVSMIHQGFADSFILTLELFDARHRLIRSSTPYSCA